jgi:hypothetical protein
MRHRKCISLKNGVLGKFAVAKLHFPDEVFLEKLLRLLGS